MVTFPCSFMLLGAHFTKIASEFDIIGSMFPQLEHLAVEESSASPSIFSRYGIIVCHQF
ncbi:hypothetical protein V6Z11_1Z061500 [Gossypium hirsutum]